MVDGKKTARSLMASLQERAKELNCLYEVDDILRDVDRPLGDILQSVVRVIPPGFQYPDVCEVRITWENRVFGTSTAEPTRWTLRAPVRVRDEREGEVCVFYTEARPRCDEGPFLSEETRLLETIAERLGSYVQFRRLRKMHDDIWNVSLTHDNGADGAWRGPIQLLRKADRNLYRRIARRMINHLCWIGVDDARELVAQSRGDARDETDGLGEVNQPSRRNTLDERILLGELPFELAARHMSDEEILVKVQQWMQEERASFFGRVLDDPRSSLREVDDALRRFHHLVADGVSLSGGTINGLLVSLVRRFLSDQLEYIVVSREHLETTDFEELIRHLIAPEGGHARLGGKGAGLFLAHRVLERALSAEGEPCAIRVPRTWFLAASWLTDFVRYNDLHDLVDQKYKTIDQSRLEYPNVIQLFKSSRFPPDLVRELSMILDDLGDRPLIVRSSSLLEDRLGTAFSGKYKSLFLANTGTRKENLDALLDAIAEIYASTIGPDPLEYRRERHLLDFNEEMGILVQEVVGVRLGHLFLPALAGVAFSRNEFRWSPRIRRADGLVRMVPGLGTRAVDRVGDDYPVLAVPGQPGLRANATDDEIVRYAPRRIDVIDLETSTFQTMEIADLLGRYGTDFPAFEKLFSVFEEGRLRPASRLLDDPASADLVPTCEGMLGSTPFMKQMARMLDVLEEKLGWPVDIEFAHDGTDLYLLQCRPQSQTQQCAPAAIPKDVPRDRIVFTARRHVSNGSVPDLTHVVYVDPDGYAGLADHEDLLAVGRAVGRLNKMLPKKQFALLGPGRWGSRGDVKLGVRVGYSDISNTALLVEIARRKGSYVPDLSFGTHFFQDLVEAEIRYLPLYPDEEDVLFNDIFLRRSPNLLEEMLPDHAHLADVVRVIDVPAATGGQVLRVLMNADLNEALCLLVPTDDAPVAVAAAGASTPPPQPSSEHWNWRLSMAEHIASMVEPERFGVVAMYVLGSTKNATAGPASDIDLLVHFRGDEVQRRDLDCWLEGWSLCLARLNYLRTGYETPGLLDVHVLTDEDIEKRTSWAVKIGAVTDAARPLKLGTED